MSDAQIFRAALLHTPANPFRTEQALVTHEDGGLLVHRGRIVASGDFASVRARDPDAHVVDWRGAFLLPGFVDTHVHFPQLRIIGSLGRTLLDWLEQVALPEEARMADRRYASDTANAFVHALASHGTTTAMVFGAHFAEATAALFDAAAQSGVRVVSGLVVSDRLLRPELHQSPDDAYRDSVELIRKFHRHGRLLYAVTPRFALSTTEAMLEMCQALSREHEGLRFQTHINESIAEISEVSRLFPWATDYLGVYDRYGFGGTGAVMAHNVHASDGELERLASARTAVAHCPCSNAALGSGLFPMRRHIDAGVRVALGTNVGGGTGFGLLKEGLQAYLMQRVATDGFPLTPSQLLYLATLAGAEALGLDAEIGDFRAGKAADFVCLRPAGGTPFAAALERAESLEQALAKLFTLGDAAAIHEVRIEGTVVYQAGAR